MGKSLIKIHGFIYKIKKIIINLIGKFFKCKTENEFRENANAQVKINNNILDEILQKEKIEDIQRKKNLAEKIKQGEIDIYSLSDKETEEMIQYFDEYIEERNIKLHQIKQRIEYKIKGENNGT